MNIIQVKPGNTLVPSADMTLVADAAPNPVGVGSRLSDPHNVAGSPERLALLRKKISDCMTKMFRQPRNGGNPFLFSLAAPKPHILATKLSNCAVEFNTAATDGKIFYWHPDFLESLTDEEVPTIMEHEIWHQYCDHPRRMRGCDQQIANWALDYVVNGIIIHSRKKAGFSGQIWGRDGSALGKPMPLATLLSYLDGADVWQGVMCFVDETVHGRSPESIYDEIIQHWANSPRKCKTCGALSINPKTRLPYHEHTPLCDHLNKGECPVCGSHPSSGTMDEHIAGSLTKDEAMADLMKARQQASQICKGCVPDEAEAMLGELSSPTLSFTDIVKSAFMKKIQDVGQINDWKHIRRRWLACSPKQYLPKKYMHTVRWLCLLDTSGSMSDDDIAYGVSQLQVLSERTEGFIVPCDASPKWKDASRVTSKSDLKRTKVVGRGGTVFDEFFRDFPKFMGKEFDLIVVLTDGEIGEIPNDLKPPMDVVWVLVNNNAGFTPPFGRVAPLRVTKKF